MKNEHLHRDFVLEKASIACGNNPLKPFYPMTEKALVEFAYETNKQMIAALQLAKSKIASNLSLLKCDDEFIERETYFITNIIEQYTP